MRKLIGIVAVIVVLLFLAKPDNRVKFDSWLENNGPGDLFSNALTRTGEMSNDFWDNVDHGLEKLETANAGQNDGFDFGSIGTVVAIGGSSGTGSVTVNGTPVADNEDISERNSVTKVKYVFFADSGTADENAKAVADLVERLDPNYVFIAGDLVYNGNSYQAAVGDLYGDYLGDPNMGEVLRLYSALGNHDYSEPGGTQAYLDYFHYPSNERWYRVDLGLCKFWVLDTMSAVQNASDWDAQKAWLQTGLQESKSECDIVLGHHPPRTSGLRPGTSETSAVSAVDLPYLEWGAEASVWGHFHGSEIVVTNKFPYFIVGTGGGALYKFGSPIEGSISRVEGEYGVLELTVTLDSMFFRFLDLQEKEHFNFERKFSKVQPPSMGAGNQQPTRTPTSTPLPTPTPVPIILWMPAEGLTMSYADYGESSEFNALRLYKPDLTPFNVGAVCEGNVFSVLEKYQGANISGYEVIQQCNFPPQWIHIKYTLARVDVKDGDALLKGMVVGRTEPLNPNLWIQMKINNDDEPVDPTYYLVKP